MLVCTFFGHKDTSYAIEKDVYITLKDLIENKGVNMFYVGNQGNFDCIIRKVLKELKLQYPKITYKIVLAYLHVKEKVEGDINTIYPEGLEIIPRKFAIVKRNKWMLEKSDYVVTYVRHNFGGAAKFKELAEKKGKIVINIADNITNPEMH